MTQRIGVLGSGSWGTALAVHLAHTGHDVRLSLEPASIELNAAAVIKRLIMAIHLLGVESLILLPVGARGQPGGRTWTGAGSRA